MLRAAWSRSCSLSMALTSVEADLVKCRVLAKSRRPGFPSWGALPEPQPGSAASAQDNSWALSGSVLQASEFNCEPEAATIDGSLALIVPWLVGASG